MVSRRERPYVGEKMTNSCWKQMVKSSMRQTGQEHCAKPMAQAAILHSSVTG